MITGTALARLALVLCCVLPAAGAHAAERYALLVGVGRMPALPAASWLDGPARDIAAMRITLQGQGFEPARIMTLGETGGPMPTRAGILAGLAQLAERAVPGDVVLLYWSGHGVLQAGYPGQQLGPMGHGVRLLTRDSASSADARQPAGGVSSDELGRAIDALAARQARVIAIFDTCHAAGTTRSAPDGLAWRGIAATDLYRLPAGLAMRASPARARPGFVGFFAAEAQQRTAEARAVVPGQASGLFTAALIDALKSSPASYQAWANATAQRYRQVLGTYSLPASRWPSPVFAGALELGLWDEAPQAAAWLVKRDAQGWYVPYGLLDGVREGDRFARGRAHWQVVHASWGKARLSPPEAMQAQEAIEAIEAKEGWASRIAAPRPPALTVRRAGRMHHAALQLPNGEQVQTQVHARQVPALRSQAGRIADLLSMPPSVQQFVTAEVELSLPGKPPRRLPFADRDLGELPVGTRLRVIVENRGSDSVDLGIAHLPLAGAATRIFPAFAADSNRMPPGIAPAASRFEQQFEVTGRDAGPEWLTLVAAPAANGAMPRRFDLLAALPDMPATRSERNALHVPHSDSAQLARLRWTTVPSTANTVSRP